MNLYLLGINHRTADVAVRERLAMNLQDLTPALAELRRCEHVAEAMILSTCNRTEIYCATERDAPAVRQWLHERTEGDPIADDCFYELHGREAVHHACSVAAGIDSLVLGEPQILGQMKDAYRVALDSGATGPLLNRVIQHAFATAKTVRTSTSIGESAVSAASAAVQLARQVFAGFDNHTALLIGAGEIMEITARHLHHQRLKRMIIANRSVDRARTLAASFGAYAIALDELELHLAEADLVISSTASPSAVISHDQVVRALKNRRHRPMLFIDLAVPRDVAPEVAELRDTYVYTVDDLRRAIDKNLAARQEAAEKAGQIIERETRALDRKLDSLDAVPLIRGVREDAHRMRALVVAEARRQIEAGQPADEVLERLAHKLTKKLLHAPTTSLRAAAERGDDALIDAARRLFGLDDGSD